MESTLGCRTWSRQPPPPDQEIQIRAVPLGLLAGVEIDLVSAVHAPDPQQEMRLRCAAERGRPGLDLKAFPSHIAATMQPNLSPEEYAEIAALLRDTIAAYRFPMSPRIKSLRMILNKIAPPAPPKPTPFPPLKPPGAPSMLLAKKSAPTLRLPGSARGGGIAKPKWYGRNGRPDSSVEPAWKRR
jgi:hypothetical protein